jgi:hypothetical protein
MLMGLTYEEILDKIKEKGLSQEEIEKKIQQRLEQLSGLISKEGAAQIIANELGVKIFRDIGKVKVNEIKSGMRDIEVDGKIVTVNEVRSFKTPKREGKVASFMLGDETGQIRIVIWDESQIKLVEDKKVIENIIVKLKNTYCRDNNGFKELHLNSGSEIILNPEGVKIEGVAASQPALDFVSKKINELTQNDRNVILRGTVVQLFDPRFYEICEQCGKRAISENGNFNCADHGIVNVKYAVVLNMFFDDGSDNIRIVCFRDAAANVLGKNEEELSKLKDNPAEFEIFKNDVLGKQLEVSGRTSMNEMFNRLEFVANSVEELKPEKLLEGQN